MTSMSLTANLAGVSNDCARDSAPVADPPFPEDFGVCSAPCRGAFLVAGKVRGKSDRKKNARRRGFGRGAFLLSTPARERTCASLGGVGCASRGPDEAHADARFKKEPLRMSFLSSIRRFLGFGNEVDPRVTKVTPVNRLSLEDRFGIVRAVFDKDELGSPIDWRSLAPADGPIVGVPRSRCRPGKGSPRGWSECRPQLWLRLHYDHARRCHGRCGTSRRVLTRRSARNARGPTLSRNTELRCERGTTRV